MVAARCPYCKRESIGNPAAIYHEVSCPNYTHPEKETFAYRVAEEVYNLKHLCETIGYPFDQAEKEFQELARTTQLSIIEAIREVQRMVSQNSPTSN